MTDLPWGAMLKLAGVKVAEIATRTGLSSAYVYAQLNGRKPMQYNVEMACVAAIREASERWYPPVASMIQILHGQVTGQLARACFREEREHCRPSRVFIR